MDKPSLLLAALSLFMLAFVGCLDTEAPAGETTHSSVSEQILRLQRGEAQVEAARSESESSRGIRQSQPEVPADAPVASGPSRELGGKIESRRSQRPEVGCEVKHGAAVAYTERDGSFRLDAVPSGGSVRLRMSCRGHIERQRVLVPNGAGAFELQAPLVVGPRAGQSAGSDVDEPPRVSISDAIRQMDEERVDDDGDPSILRTAVRGLTNFAGTAAAVSTAGEEERYRVLGQWKRAEEETNAQAEADSQSAPADSDARDDVPSSSP